MVDPLRVMVECWENQRYHFSRGWGPHRLPVDRPSWSNKRGDLILCRESFLTPIGWVWANDWAPAIHNNNNNNSKKEEEGWLYAADFSIPTRFCTLKPNAMSYVRRRRWVRTRVQLTNLNPTTENDFEVFMNSLTFNIDPRVVWLSTSFYGFTGASIEEQREDQQRQHICCYWLHRYLDISCSSAYFNNNENIDCNQDNKNSSDNNNNNNKTKINSSSSSLFFLSSPSPQHHPSVTVDVRHCVYIYGLPQCLRPALWFEWSGASLLLRASPRLFDELIERSHIVQGQPLQDIMQDVVRTAPRHPFFAKRGGGGAEELRNVLFALEIANVLPSYHQAFSYIVATVLLNLPAREAFWVVTSLFDKFLPHGYHEQYRIRYDFIVYNEIISQRLPDVHAHFKSKKIDVSVFASGWLQGLFCAHFPFCTAARILDIMFADGDSSILVRFLIAFTYKFRNVMLTMDSSGSLGHFANEWARNCFNVNELVHFMEKDGLKSTVLTKREKLIRSEGLNTI